MICSEYMFGYSNELHNIYRTLFSLNRTALEAIVFEAGDADTNGAVAGALLGCKLGLSALPSSWLNKLLHKKWLDGIIEQYVIRV